MPRYRNAASAAVLVLAFAGGVSLHMSTPVRIGAVMSLASAITLWCTLDARMHGKLFLRSFGWTMMFTWPIGVLAHLVWTRGRRGVLVYLGVVLAYFVALGGGQLMGMLMKELSTALRAEFIE